MKFIIYIYVCIYKWIIIFCMCQNVQYTTTLNMKSCDFNIAPLLLLHIYYFT